MILHGGSLVDFRRTCVRGAARCGRPLLTFGFSTCIFLRRVIIPATFISRERILRSLLAAPDYHHPQRKRCMAQGVRFDSLVRIQGAVAASSPAPIHMRLFFRCKSLATDQWQAVPAFRLEPVGISSVDLFGRSVIWSVP